MVGHRVRCVAVAAFALVATGCAEVNQRGGLVAEIEDWVLFRAYTKSHRLLRSYILTAGFATVARNARISDVERDAVSGRLKAALSVAEEAYYCLYPKRYKKKWSDQEPALPVPVSVSKPQPIPCIFFDERMTRLDYAIYRLATEVMLDQESQSLFANVRDSVIGDVPVAGRAVRTASKAVETANSAAATVYEATSFAESLFRLSFHSSRRFVWLLPIYRDTLEFDMRLVLHSLRDACGRQPFAFDSATATVPRTSCSLLDEGASIFGNGNGNMTAWRDFIRRTNGALQAVEAHPIHFAIVTRWLYYACAGLFAGTVDRVSKEVLKVIGNRCSPLIEFIELDPKAGFKVEQKVASGNPEVEELNAERAQPSRVVRQPPAVAPASPPLPQATGTGPVEADPGKPGTTGSRPQRE